jgi:hypothetical protein
MNFLQDVKRKQLGLKLACCYENNLILLFQGRN